MKPTRAVRARVIRDHLLPMMKDGSFVACDNRPDARFLQRGIGPFSIALHTPFTPLPTAGPAIRTYTEAALLQTLSKPTTLPYRLDVWHGGRKVMSVQWSDSDEIGVISFRPGLWEAEALALSG